MFNPALVPVVGDAREEMAPSHPFSSTNLEEFAREQPVGSVLIGEVVQALCPWAEIRLPGDVAGRLHMDRIEGAPHPAEAMKALFPGRPVMVRVLGFDKERAQVRIAIPRGALPEASGRSRNSVFSRPVTGDAARRVGIVAVLIAVALFTTSRSINAADPDRFDPSLSAGAGVGFDLARVGSKLAHGLEALFGVDRQQIGSAAIDRTFSGGLREDLIYRHEIDDGVAITGIRYLADRLAMPFSGIRSLHPKGHRVTVYTSEPDPRTISRAYRLLVEDLRQDRSAFYEGIMTFEEKGGVWRPENLSAEPDTPQEAAIREADAAHGRSAP